MNRKLPILAAMLTILALAPDGVAFAQGMAAPVAKLGKAVKGAINKGRQPGPAPGQAKPAKSKKGQSDKGSGTYKSWQKSHSWHAGISPNHGPSRQEVRLDLADNGRPGKDGLDSGVFRS